jgi:hypothetical protein
MYGQVNQTYGPRELLLLAPDGNLLVFGRSLRTCPLRAASSQYSNWYATPTLLPGSFSGVVP